MASPAGRGRRGGRCSRQNGQASRPRLVLRPQHAVLKVHRAVSCRSGLFKPLCKTSTCDCSVVSPRLPGGSQRGQGQGIYFLGNHSFCHPRVHPLDIHRPSRSCQAWKSCAMAPGGAAEQLCEAPPEGGGDTAPALVVHSSLS